MTVGCTSPQPLATDSISPQEDESLTVAQNKDNNGISSDAVWEQKTHDKINEYRSQQGLPPLQLESRINDIARVHSQDMAIGKVEFSHDGVEGRYEAISQVISFRQVAENVAYNYGFSDPFKSAVEGWINSPIDNKIGVYFFDGAHDYRSQLMGLLFAIPFLSDQALIIVDDTNFISAKQANYYFLALNSSSELILDLPTPRNFHPTFWNGIQVFSFDRSKNSAYDW